MGENDLRPTKFTFDVGGKDDRKQEQEILVPKIKICFLPPLLKPRKV